MPLILKEEEKKFHLVPADTHQCVCFGIWDIGIQKVEFKGHVKALPKIVIGWETAATIESNDTWNGQRYRIYKKYTFSMFDKATLRKDLESWRGRKFTDEEKKGFDVETVLNANCFISVIHHEVNNKTYTNVGAIMPLPKGIPIITPENKPDMPEWIIKLRDKALSLSEADDIRAAEKENVSDDTDIQF